MNLHDVTEQAYKSGYAKALPKENDLFLFFRDGHSEKVIYGFQAFIKDGNRYLIETENGEYEVIEHFVPVVSEFPASPFIEITTIYEYFMIKNGLRVECAEGFKMIRKGDMQ